MIPPLQNIHYTEGNQSSCLIRFFPNKIRSLFSSNTRNVNVINVTKKQSQKTPSQDKKLYILNKHTFAIITKDFGEEAGKKVETSIKNIAAIIIQRYCRKTLARNTYNYMLTSGKIYKRRSNYLKKYMHFQKYYDKNNHHKFNCLEDMQIFSTSCLNEIKDVLGNLSLEEQLFINRVNSFSNMILMHRTDAYLVKNDVANNKNLTIYSNKYIEKNNIITPYSFTSLYDITILANNDFVFCTPYFTESKNKQDAVKKIVNSDIINLTFNYGKNAYFFIKKDCFYGYLTLTDSQFYKVDVNYKLYTCKKLYQKIPRRITGFERRKCRDVPMFLSKDMNLGIAYHTVYFLRKLQKYQECANFCDKVLNVKNPEDFNKIIHTIFNPEFHVPKVLAIKNPEIFTDYIYGLKLKS